MPLTNPTWDIEFLTVAGHALRVVEGSARQLPSLYLGARKRMFDQSVISTERDERRVFEVDVDFYNPDEWLTIWAACPRGVPVIVDGMLWYVGTLGLMTATVDFTQHASFLGNPGSGSTDPASVWRTVTLHIEEAPEGA